MKKEAMPRMSSLPSDLATDRSSNGKAAQTMEDSRQSNTGQTQAEWQRGLERHSHTFCACQQSLLRAQCCLPKPKPFGTNPAAKMTLETNKASLARKRNTKHTKDREDGEKKKEKIFLVTEQVCLQLQASTPVKGWPQLFHSRKQENLTQRSS